jgi:hypothetical protein
LPPRNWNCPTYYRSMALCIIFLAITWLTWPWMNFYNKLIKLIDIKIFSSHHNNELVFEKICKVIMIMINKIANILYSKKD